MTRLRIAVVAGLTALLTLGLSVPAQASDAVPLSAPGGCPSGALCVYSGLNYSGTHSYLQNCNRSWATFGRTNIDASWFNNGTSGRWARIWTGFDFTGNWVSIARGVGVPDGTVFPDSIVYNQGKSNDWPLNGDGPPPSPSQCPD